MPVATTPGPADGDRTPEAADSVGGGTGGGVGLTAELHPPAIMRRISSVAVRGQCLLGLLDPARGS
jgi:hypothetical protein